MTSASRASGQQSTRRTHHTRNFTTLGNTISDLIRLHPPSGSAAGTFAEEGFRDQFKATRQPPHATETRRTQGHRPAETVRAPDPDDRGVDDRRQRTEPGRAEDHG